LSRVKAGIALLALAQPASAGLYTGSCGMVWTDTGILFGRNNEMAYYEERGASMAPIAANLIAEAPDFSNLSWSDAFRETCAYMEERYAFTEWRGIDWDSLYLAYAPKIAEAERNRDSAAYYRTLREFVYAVQDGHALVRSPGDFGGGYGFSIAMFDMGKVIVTYVANGSGAEKAGIRSCRSSRRATGIPNRNRSVSTARGPSSGEVP